MPATPDTTINYFNTEYPDKKHLSGHFSCSAGVIFSAAAYADSSGAAEFTLRLDCTIEGPKNSKLSGALNGGPGGPRELTVHEQAPFFLPAGSYTYKLVVPHDDKCTLRGLRLWLNPAWPPLT